MDAEGDPDDYPDGYSDDYREQGYANYPSPSQGQGAMPKEHEGPGQLFCSDDGGCRSARQHWQSCQCCPLKSPARS